MLTKINLVDGTGVLMFLKTISQFYQGLGPVDPPPYYEPEAIKFPEPSTSLTAIEPFDPSGSFPWERPHRKEMEFVAFRLTASQVAQIHGTIAQGKEHLRISRADVLTGMLARCFSEFESKPIHTILSVVNVRPSEVFLRPGSFYHSTAEWVYTH